MALQANEARTQAQAIPIGAAAAAAYDGWTASLPDDVGPAEALAQPDDITRFDATTFTWRGGSNSGSNEWTWTANFEAYSVFPAWLGQTPAGTYRFVVDGHISDGSVQTYQLRSEPVTVRAWDGVNVDDARLEMDGSVSFTAGSHYPRTYDSPFPFIADDGRTDVCKTCTFRPWARTSEVVDATVTVTRSDGSIQRVAATGEERWTAATDLGPGDEAAIEPGDLVDANGEINGRRLVLASARASEPSVAGSIGGQ